MAAVAGNQRRRRIRVWRGAVLAVAAAYFLIPLYAAVRYAVKGTKASWTLSAFGQIPKQEGFSAAFTLSLRLAVVTTVITLVMMVPTAVYIHLRLPSLKPLFDGITILPIVIPPVVLIVGVLQVAPSRLKGTPYLLSLEYAVLAMPFAYRALSTGLSAIDLNTLVEASRSLGAGWWNTLRRVVIPNLRTALLSATVLTVALVLGEFTMASLDQYQTFPVWVVNTDQYNSHVSTAASILALLLTWALLIVIASVGSGRRGARRAERQLEPAVVATPMGQIGGLA
jgi:putative spermidine/putrescine transport system permease protein